MSTYNIIKNDVITIKELDRLQSSSDVISINKVGVTGFYEGYDIYKIKLLNGSEHEVFVS